MSGHLDLDKVDWRALFDELHPGFFDRPNIKNLPAGRVYEEMALDLRAFSPQALEIPAPGDLSFGLYAGDLEALRRQVARVDARSETHV